jgi:glycosyltransferase involved in cell wall biosynthesis
MGLLGTTAGFLTRVPKRIFTCRGFRFESERGFKRVLLKSLDKLTSSFAHKVICISPSVKEFGVKQGVLSEQKSFVIQHGSSNGLCLERFNSLKISWEKKINIKEKLSLGDTFVFGFIGRLVKDKGIEELLKAFDNINKEYNKTSLIVLGSTKSSTSYEKNLILHYKNHTGIRWVGFVENVNEYIAIMDVFVMPTYREGFGIALLEAAAMGKPVISTNVTGAKDAVKNNYNGLLVSHKSISDLENAMLKLYKDNSLKEKLGKNGIEWARNFDNNIIWEGMNKLYNS